MYSIIVTIVAAICAYKWLSNYVAGMALMLYIHGKYDTVPSETEMEPCLREAWLRILHIK